MSDDQKTCDRCGAQRVTAMTLPMLPSMDYTRSRSLCRASLCPDCMTELSDWWFMHPTFMDRYFVTRRHPSGGDVVMYVNARGREVDVSDEMDGPTLADIVEVARAHEKALRRDTIDR